MTERFDQGMATRRTVLGDAHVDRAEAQKTDFDRPFQELITNSAWGTVWASDGISRRERSMLTLALMVALGREEEFKLHVRPALRNGVTLPELRALLIQCAVYAGVPAANAAFRWVRDVLGDELDRA